MIIHQSHIKHLHKHLYVVKNKNIITFENLCGLHLKLSEDICSPESSGYVLLHKQ